MNKSILIIDTPESCSKCPLFHGYYSDMTCGANDFGINYPYPDTFRQKWCPLKPLPEKYDIEEEMKKPHDRDCTWEFEGGYNACIDELLGDII